MEEVNNPCFEGKADRRVVKSDFCLCQELELTGMMIAHSALQGGPGHGVPFMSPSQYECILSVESTISPDFCVQLPSKDDINFNAATSTLNDLISEVSFLNSMCLL